MSTEVDLDEAQRLCDQASPGPWISNGEHEYIPAMATKAVMIRTLTDEPNWPRPAMARQTNDAEFIAAARSLMPALIAEVREADYVCRVTGEKLTAVKEQRDAAEAALTRVRAVAAKPWNAFAGRDVLLDAVRAAVGTTPEPKEALKMCEVGAICPVCRNTNLDAAETVCRTYNGVHLRMYECPCGADITVRIGVRAAPVDAPFGLVATPEETE